MIAGIGTDLCDIRRIEALLDKFGERFTRKTFTKGERDYAQSKAGQGSTYAKRFAAKEAVAKALAGANTGALSWQDVEVVNSPSGNPEIALHGGALARVKSRLKAGQSYKLHISLSDEYPYAQAYAVLEIL